MSYQVLGPFDFGKQLLVSGDLDPVYIGLYHGVKSEPLLQHTLLAYWCCYHLGASLYIAERARGKDAKFWSLLHDVARNDAPVPGFKDERRWPRSSERRHWRGQQAIDSAASLYAKARDVGRFFRWIEGPGTFTGINERVRSIRGFGPWIAFKVPDMLERVLGVPVDFDDCHLDFYDEPRKGAALVLHGDPEAAIAPHEVEQAVENVGSALRRYKAPPRGDRKVNVQEIETVLCKYKSHWKGSYPVGKDIREVRHGLHGWGDLAKHVRDKMPKEV